jgi:glucose-6-phosphate isomerase
LSALFVAHSPAPWTLDATVANVTEAELDALHWKPAFDAMEALEAGEIANPDEGRQVGHYWLRAPETAPTVLQGQAIGETAEKVRIFADNVLSGEVVAEGGERFTHLVHIGIGGSALGPQMLVEALGGGGLEVRFLDNIDPDGIARILSQIPLRSTLVTVASKSGSTAEPMNALELVLRELTRQGLEHESRLVALTVAGSKLDKRAANWLARFHLWQWIGGRNSVMSSVGLLPAALAGIDTEQLLRGARDMDEWTRTPAWRDNPAALLAGCWHVLGDGRGTRNMAVIPYSDRMVLLSQYLQQLVMESLGKATDVAGNPVSQGLTVYGNKGSTDQHAIIQQLRDGHNDFFCLLVQVLGDGLGSGALLSGSANAGDLLQAFLLGTRRALHENGRPSLTLTVPRIDAYILGGVIALFDRAVGLYATLIDINAYHQPGVEAGKRASAAMLVLAASVQTHLAEHKGTAAEIAAALGGDPLEVQYILARLAATGRAEDSDGVFSTTDEASP